MESNIEVIGSESSVIYYNLNKQFCDIKKIIITKEIILNSYETDGIKELISKLQTQDKELYKETIQKAEEDQIFEIHIKSELYQKIQESISKITNMMDVKLKDYNFMSSVSNTKFNLTLRCEDISITKYYIEKGEIISVIKKIVKKYLENELNIYRTNRLDHFQIEINESEEIHKKITLKKESSNLLLTSSFGFPFNSPINYEVGSEFYFSIGEEFDFFKNKQTTALFRDHNKIIEKEINIQEKILSNDELIMINNRTKNINDAVIEMYINSKGILKITNLSILENSLFTKSKNGIVLNKSSKNYDKISLITLRDNFDDELPNPKYLLIRNENEVKELIENFKMLQKVDGIILTINFYSQILDKISNQLDIDVIFVNQELNKSLEVKIDMENLEIESTDNKNQTTATNPFKNIIGEQNKGKDEFLERLKNIDLNEPIQNEVNQQPTNTNQVSQITEGLMSSRNSSINNRGNSQMNWPTNNSNNEKKSAMDFLMDSVKNHKPVDRVQQKNNNNNIIDATKPQFQERSFIEIKEEVSQQQVEQTQPYHQPVQTPEFSQHNQENYNHPQSPMNDILGDSEPNNFQTEEILEQKTVMDYENKIDMTKYENIIATKIMTPPTIASRCYFVDMNTISDVQDGEIFFLATNPHEMQNPNLKYILPIELNEKSLNDCYLLLNSPSDYFLIDKEQKVNYFLNLSKINSLIKEAVLKETIDKLGIVSVIITKENIHLIENYINKIENVFVKDLTTNEEYVQIKNKILGYEKKYLIRN